MSIIFYNDGYVQSISNENRYTIIRYKIVGYIDVYMIICHYNFIIDIT